MTDDTTTMGAASPLDELRASFAEQVPERSLFKLLPSERAKHKLVAEYRLLSMAEAAEALDNEGDISKALGPLSKALVQLHYHAPEHPRVDPDTPAGKRGLVPLHIYLDVEHLGPLGLDKRLTDLLGMEAGPAADILLELFDRHEIAAGGQAGELALWSHDTTQERYQDFTEGS